MSDVATGSQETSAQAEIQAAGRWKTLWREFSKNRLAVFGLGVVAAMVLAAVFAPLLAPYDPYGQNYGSALGAPTLAHPMGTDSLGSDILSRVIHGARISLQAALISVGIALAAGVPLGLVSGYFRGFVDEVIIMRLVDSLQAFPFLILALVIASVLGGGLTYAMVAIGIGFTPAFVRITRGQVLTVRNREYVQAARAIGTSNVSLMLRHVLPNSLPPLLVQTTLALGYAIIAEATLSFLGLGAEPGVPSWGSMLFQAQAYITSAWWMALFPGLAIFFAVLGFNLLGDGVREALDPRSRR